jgi:hypothetical protein
MLDVKYYDEDGELYYCKNEWVKYNKDV